MTDMKAPPEPPARKAARAYMTQGYAPIPLPARSKNPDRKGWQNERHGIEDLSRIWKNGQGVGLLLGEPSGGLVDVDLDVPEAVRLGGRFLPPTRTSGREGIRDSHWWFHAPGSKTAKFADIGVEGEMLVELRSTGCQTVVEPSIHPAGDRYLWSRSGLEAAQVGADALLESCRRLAAAVLIARHLPASGRHDFALALVGYLLRNGLDEETVLKILVGAWNVNDAPDEGLRDLHGIVRDTRARLERDEPVKGGRTLDGLVGGMPKALAKFLGWERADNGEGYRRNTSPTPGRFNLTDVGNAERLVERHGEDIRYCFPLNQWLHFGGQRWRGDDAGEVERRSKETVRATLREAAPEEGPIVDRDLARHALASESRARIEAMIALARSEPGIPIRPEEMDPDQWLLNVENGTIDLKTGELREHRREDLITQLAPVEYDPSAKAPTWEACLETWLPSEGLRRFVQKAVGYALTGDVSEQVLLFLYGPGANGKSTLINAIMEAMGDYALQAAPELLTVKASAHPTELADLKGARFVASVEVEDGKHLAESLVKQMTGGDRIKARFMRGDFFEFSPTHKVFLAANHKPEVRGTDTGIWRRIKTVPFDVTIPKGGRDPALPAKLREELPGILRWAVEGCLLWQREGLGEPEEVKAATAEYRAEMDVLAGFIEERCVTRPGAWAKFADLYAEYETWCRESGELAEKKRTFGTRLKERGFSPAKGTDNVSIRTGITLRSDREPPDGPPDDGDQGPEKDQEDYPSTVKYPDSGLKNKNDSHVGLTSKQGTDEYLGNPGGPLDDIFSDPPDWLATQLDKCREEERFVKPTCATAAEEVLGTVTRWAEVEPVLRRHLSKGGRP